MFVRITYGIIGGIFFFLVVHFSSSLSLGMGLLYTFCCAVLPIVLASRFIIEAETESIREVLDEYGWLNVILVAVFTWVISFAFFLLGTYLDSWLSTPTDFSLVTFGNVWTIPLFMLVWAICFYAAFLFVRLFGSILEILILKVIKDKKALVKVLLSIIIIGISYFLIIPNVVSSGWVYAVSLILFPSFALFAFILRTNLIDANQDSILFNILSGFVGGIGIASYFFFRSSEPDLASISIIFGSLVLGLLCSFVYQVIFSKITLPDINWKDVIITTLLCFGLMALFFFVMPKFLMHAPFAMKVLISFLAGMLFVLFSFMPLEKPTSWQSWLIVMAVSILFAVAGFVCGILFNAQIAELLYCVAVAIFFAHVFACLRFLLMNGLSISLPKKGFSFEKKSPHPPRAIVDRTL